MATPSSSATSPSPPMAFLTHLSLASQSPPPSSMESDDTKKAVQKFLARAELSSVTRSLRTRLAQASSKAGGANPNLSFRELDAQSPPAFSRLNAAKRKTPHYNYNPPGQNTPGVGTTVGQLRKGGIPTMVSPLGVTPRANGSVGASTSGTADASGSSRNATAQTLFTSILAPPPAKQARTILNANDPPRAAPVRPMPSPRTVTSTKVARSIAEGTRAHAKSRSLKKSPDKRKDKASKRRRPDGVDADGDVEMKAAAALTSLLQHHRPSISSAASPRSSIDAGSDAGSSYSQYTQPTARMINPAASASSMASTSTIVAEPTTRSSTPPVTTTPRPAPTDNEAADLMLYLATSPSPVRQKDTRELSAYRALGGAPPKGRVLFPTAADSEDTPNRGASMLQRSGGEAPSIGGDVASPEKVPTLSAAQLLPPPPMPSSPSYRKIHDASPRSAPGPDFFNEYINASPSPARPKANATLRAEVGRKLFEEEQMRLSMAMSGVGGPKSSEQQRPLSAGVDLVKS